MQTPIAIDEPAPVVTLPATPSMPAPAPPGARPGPARRAAATGGDGT